MQDRLPIPNSLLRRTVGPYIGSKGDEIYAGQFRPFTDHKIDIADRKYVVRRSKELVCLLP